MPVGAVRAFLMTAAVLMLSSAAFGITIQIATSEDQSTVIIDDAPDQEVYVIGKSVIVNKSAKGVLAVGGDVVVEGRIEGDVATIGGNVIQKENAYIGGDIIVFGGAYKPESSTPQREEGKETVTFGVFEDEIRDLGKNPSHIFAPALTVGFIAQRFVLALFWFIISLVLATLAPGAVSRAVARLSLSGLKVSALGAAVIIGIITLAIGGALLLPNYLSVTLAFMGMLLLMLGYVFGRVTLQVSVGKLIQKRFFPENNRSETLAILAGVVFWTVLLSMPFIWVFALFAIFIIGTGLILTGRASTRWQNP